MCEISVHGTLVNTHSMRGSPTLCAYHAYIHSISQDLCHKKDEATHQQVYTCMPILHIKSLILQKNKK